MHGDCSYDILTSRCQVFTGNSDQNSKVVGKFPTPINCRYVRIVPLSVNGWISLRFELIRGICFDEY